MPPSQSTAGRLSADQMREAIASLSSPDRVDSPFGTLSFFGGVPSAQTVDVIYDALDLIRGIDVFLNCLPGASLVALRRGLRSIGVETPAFIAYTDPSVDSTGLALTANTETTYGTTFLDLKEWGPTVVESPPGSLCVIDDFWFRYVADMGIPGPDKGHGGKYLYLPPGYDDEVPEGYFVFRSPTYTNSGQDGVQHGPCQRLHVLRGGQRARPGGTRRRARCRAGRAAGSDWDRQRTAVCA